MALYQILFSPTGGTARAAALLAEGIGETASALDLCDPAFAPMAFQKEDVCLVAMPVYGGRVPDLAARRFGGCRGNGARAVVMAVYGNREFEDALAELQDLAEAAGFTVIAGVAAVAEHSIVREFGRGRPDQADAAVLRDMGRRLRERLAQQDSGAPALPGDRPYQACHLMPIGIRVSEACTGCGLCARKCPVGAIDPAAPSLPAKESCISCMRCVAVCPSGARSVDPARIAALKEKIGPACRERKENRLFW